jgi:hypothetical protein
LVALGLIVAGYICLCVASFEWLFWGCPREVLPENRSKRSERKSGKIGGLRGGVPPYRQLGYWDRVVVTNCGKMSCPVVSPLALDGYLTATYRDAVTRENWTPLIRS